MPTPSHSKSWMRGVAANAAAPSSVLLRLLTESGLPAWKVLCEERALPADVVEAILMHPDRPVRAYFARNRYADPAQRGRLVHDRDNGVRYALAVGPRHRPGRATALPDQVLKVLLAARDEDEPDPAPLLTADEIKQELTTSGQISQSFRRSMATHENPAIRAQATWQWSWFTPAQRAAFLADPAPEVRDAARQAARFLDPQETKAQLPERDGHFRTHLLLNCAVSSEVAEQCLAERRDLQSLAHNSYTPSDIVARLARDPDAAVRERVAARIDLTSELLAQLAADEDPTVRTRARIHPFPRTEPERDLIDCLIGHTAEQVGQLSEWYLQPEPDWFAACAISAHPLLRRIAATFPDLPEHLVHQLAHDPDEHTRRLLAYNHPLAPPALLLEAFIAATDQRSLLLALPHMPRTGLAHLQDYEDPEVRALAAGDISLKRPPLDQLSDPDPWVRKAAARNRLLPADTIDALLEDAELAEAAASNPRLTPEHLHRLLDQAGVA